MSVLKKLCCATIALSFALASGAAVAQEPPAAPVPKLPAMPSLEQKGSDDMTKPAGASAGKAKPAPEPKHAGKDAKKHEPEPSAPKAPASQPKEPAAKPKASAAKSKEPAARSEAPGAKRKPTPKAAAAATHSAKASKARKPTPARKARRGK